MTDEIRNLVAELLATAVEMRTGRWRVEAACRGMDPEVFYPHRGEDVAPGKAVCETCPVRAECVAYSLAAGEVFGTWGGITESVRKDYRNGRRRIVVDPVTGDVSVVRLTGAEVRRGEENQLAG